MMSDPNGGGWHEVSPAQRSATSAFIEMVDTMVSVTGNSGREAFVLALTYFVARERAIAGDVMNLDDWDREFMAGVRATHAANLRTEGSA